MLFLFSLLFETVKIKNRTVRFELKDLGILFSFWSKLENALVNFKLGTCSNYVLAYSLQQEHNQGGYYGWSKEKDLKLSC